MYTQSLLENLKERDHLGDLNVDGRIHLILKLIIRIIYTGSFCLRIGTSGGLF
jgi:hypothetical protein